MLMRMEMDTELTAPVLSPAPSTVLPRRPMLTLRRPRRERRVSRDLLPTCLSVVASHQLLTALLTGLLMLVSTSLWLPVTTTPTLATTPQQLLSKLSLSELLLLMIPAHTSPTTESATTSLPQVSAFFPPGSAASMPPTPSLALLWLPHISLVFWPTICLFNPLPTLNTPLLKSPPRS